MPERKKRRNIQQLVAGLGLGGDFETIIAKAVQEDWTTTEFLRALTRSGQFRRRFPGLIQRGGIAPFLSPIPSELSVSNLATAIRNWYSLQNAYTQGLRGFQMEVTPRRMALLIQGQVSPEELTSRALAVETVQRTPGLEAQFNDVLRAAGKKTLDKQGIFRFVARAAPRDFYDIYEAAQFGAQLGFGAQEALAAGRAAGAPGQAANVQGLIDFVRANRADIGPELAREGITDLDLIQLESGTDPRGIRQRLETLVANRRALGQFAPGFQARRGAGGGVAIFPEEAATPD